ncbi:hypothetical protein AMTR_s00109p00033160 [Amborella trichopoda]|uniref:Uncharacterized protein n=1 Tax=Amborella trichopoda TaxID=13333 RepID=W1NPG3_AMBTC|nr:hypothetical protein AMTR_s00109p00033160 [Amborella trichopoda]
MGKWRSPLGGHHLKFEGEVALQMEEDNGSKVTYWREWESGGALWVGISPCSTLTWLDWCLVGTCRLVEAEIRKLKEPFIGFIGHVKAWILSIVL